MNARSFFLVALLVVAGPAAAAAAGLDLGWYSGSGSHCPTTPGCVADMTDPCDNTATHLMLGAMLAPSGLTKVWGEDVLIRMTTDSAVLPDFWHLEAGGCREGSLSVTPPPAYGGSPCQNFWINAASGFNWISGAGGPNLAQLEFIGSLSSLQAAPMTAGLEYYLFQVQIDDVHAVADPVNQITLCAGCSIPACWVLEQVTLLNGSGPPDLQDVVVTQPNLRQWVTWFGATGTGGCPGAVPARPRTWGEVRTLFR